MRSSRIEIERQEALFADRLYRQMMKLGITQSDLANSSGINEPVIAMILTQECRPQKQTIRRLAAGLQISPSELWPGIDDA